MLLALEKHESQLPVASSSDRGSKDVLPDVVGSPEQPEQPTRQFLEPPTRRPLEPPKRTPIPRDAVEHVGQPEPVTAVTGKLLPLAPKLPDAHDEPELADPLLSAGGGRSSFGDDADAPPLVNAKPIRIIVGVMRAAKKFKALIGEEGEARRAAIKQAKRARLRSLAQRASRISSSAISALNAGGEQMTRGTRRISGAGDSLEQFARRLSAGPSGLTQAVGQLVMQRRSSRDAGDSASSGGTNSAPAQEGRGAGSNNRAPAQQEGDEGSRIFIS